MKDDKELGYIVVYDKRKKLYGVKLEGKKKWYIEPCFEGLGRVDWHTDGSSNMWFKKDGAYGLYDVKERKVLIPAEYGFPLYHNENGHAVTWKNYKAGVIDRDGNVLIPFKYDKIRYRRQYDGSKDIFRGYACFTNEGEEDVYDVNCQPSNYEDGERDRLNYVPEYDNKEVENMTLCEVESLIREEYVKLIELGYEHHKKWTMSREHQDKIDEQEEKVVSLIGDRMMKMNRSWVHNRENAKRISRMNDLLMRAVRKGIKLAKRTSKSLQWMEAVPNTAVYGVEVYICPEWQDSRSDYRYERKYKSSSKERDRLIDDVDNVSDTHIWNIIASVGYGPRYNGVGSCFEKLWHDYKNADWDEREMIGDDGQSWDECIHFPAYQDVYFTMPFHHLYLDLFDYSFEDLCNINDFRVNIDVKLQTREQDKK